MDNCCLPAFHCSVLRILIFAIIHDVLSLRLPSELSPRLCFSPRLCPMCVGQVLIYSYLQGAKEQRMYRRTVAAEKTSCCTARRSSLRNFLFFFVFASSCRWRNSNCVPRLQRSEKISFEIVLKDIHSRREGKNIPILISKQRVLEMKNFKMKNMFRRISGF